MIQCERKLAGIVAVSECFDGRFELVGMGSKGICAFTRVCQFKSVQKIQIRHLGINNDDAIAWQPNDQVRFAIALLSLFSEIAMSAHARRLDDASQCFFPPSPTRLV